MSYAGCGIPYYISGRAPELRELMSTPIEVSRSVPYFRDVKGIHVFSRRQVISVHVDEGVERIHPGVTTILVKLIADVASRRVLASGLGLDLKCRPRFPTNQVVSRLLHYPIFVVDESCRHISFAG